MGFLGQKWQHAKGTAGLSALHGQFINPQLPKVLKIIGFDRKYVKAKGLSLWDETGREVRDFLGGYSVFNLGHNPEPLLETLREVLSQSWPNLVQMDIPLFSGLLAQELIARDPSKKLQYAYFGNSGAEAVECALKFAKAATKRPRLISFDKGFHGVSMGALSLCGDESWREGFGPFLPGCLCLPYGDMKVLEKELKQQDVAAIIIEPIQGEGGVRELSQTQWDELQRLCEKYGTLLILDEIQTGMGRTGKFFAFEHWNLRPDLVCLSKALSNGMVPVSATLGSAKVFEKVFNRLDRCVVHSSTFSENNLAMAAALSVVDQIDKQDLLSRASSHGEYFLSRLREKLAPFELVKEVRGRGLMIAVEFAAPQSRKLKLGWSLIQKANKGLFGQMITVPLLSQYGFLTQVAGHNLNVLKLSPPLIVTCEEIDAFVSALTSVVEEAHRFPGGLWDVGLSMARSALGVGRKESVVLNSESVLPQTTSI